MHEVAVASENAFSIVELSATSLPKIRHRRKLTSQHSSCIKSSLKNLLSSSSTVFIIEFCIDISDEMISKVVANMKFLQFSKVREFRPNIFVEFFKVLLSLMLVNYWRWLPSLILVLLCEVLIHVRDQNRLAQRWTIVLSGTSISMSARANFEVE